MKFQGTVLDGLGRRYYTSANKVLRGSEAGRKLDIFLAPADVALPKGEHDWSTPACSKSRCDTEIRAILDLAFFRC